MSITEKLAQEVDGILKVMDDSWGIAAIKLRFYIAELKAASAAPAVEVTADAVEVACDAAMRSHNPAEVWPVHYSKTEQENARKAMQAALAAAFPVLVQQVENLKTDYALVAGHYRGLLEKYDTLSAANARLAKDAERWQKFLSDSRKSGASRWGEKGSASKLSELQIIEILDLHSKKVPRKEIASKFKVTPQSISNICNGKTWKNLTAAAAQAKQAEGGA